MMQEARYSWERADREAGQRLGWDPGGFLIKLTNRALRCRLLMRRGARLIRYSNKEFSEKKQKFGESKIMKQSV